MSYWDNITGIYNKQRAKGLKEYGMTLEDNDNLTIPETITMAQEELIDCLVYMEKIKDLFNHSPLVREIIKKYADDMKHFESHFQDIPSTEDDVTELLQEESHD